jgi:Bax protein
MKTRLLRLLLPPALLGGTLASGLALGSQPQGLGHWGAPLEISLHPRSWSELVPATGPEQAPPRQDATGEAASAGSSALSAGTRAQVARSLDDLLAWPLDGERPVPRLEVTRIPDDYLALERTEERKELFLRMLLPLVLLENERLEALRARLHTALDAGEAAGADTRRWLRGLADRYRVEGDPLVDTQAREALLARVDVIPPSLALAQAAIESAWGRSRFAREGRNLFGIWTWDAEQGIVPKRRPAGQSHYVRRFESLRDSVRYYLHNLNSHPAYAELRARRAAQRDAGAPLDSLALAEGLLRYSEKGLEYVRLIQGMIRYNELADLDDARLARAG